MTHRASVASQSSPSTLGGAEGHHFIRTDIVWFILFAVGFAVFAASLGTDATPDFRIHHYYNGFAAHHDRSTLDIFAAQQQTTNFYGLDYVYYFLFTRLNAHPVLLNVILSFPYSIAAFAVFKIAHLFVKPAFFS
jgi:hypothetical protein